MDLLDAILQIMTYTHSLSESKSDCVLQMNRIIQRKDLLIQKQYNVQTNQPDK